MIVSVGSNMFSIKRFFHRKARPSIGDKARRATAVDRATVKAQLDYLNTLMDETLLVLQNDTKRIEYAPEADKEQGENKNDDRGSGG